MNITHLDFATPAEFTTMCPDELKPLYWARPNGSYSLRPIPGLVRETSLVSKQSELAAARLRHAKELAA